MSKHKSNGKDKKKGSQFVIRVDKAERDAFVSLCDRLDTSAAREIRRFMRDLVAAHADKTPDVSVAAEAVETAEASAEIASADAAAEPASVDVIVAPVAETETPTKKPKRAAR